MADLHAILPGNVAGNFFVDDTCIDCDLCRQIAPESFRLEDEQSVVYRQPEGDSEVRAVEMSILTCPTGSIGTREKTDFREARRSIPKSSKTTSIFAGLHQGIPSALPAI